MLPLLLLAAAQTAEEAPPELRVVIPPAPDPTSPSDRYCSSPATRVIVPRAVRALPTGTMKGWGPRGEVGTPKKVRDARKRQKQARKANRR